MKKLVAVLGFLILALGVMAAGCGGDKKNQNAVYKAVVKDELTVGTEASFAPFEFYDKEPGKMIGFDVDLIRAIAKEIGYKECTIKHMDFDDLIPSVNSDKVDLVIAGLSITEERQRFVLFSQPYYKSGLAFAVRKEITDIKAFEDLKDRTIAVQKDTTGAAYGQKLKDKGAILKAFETTEEAFVMLKNKKAEAVICDLPVLQYFLKNGGSEYAKLVGKPLTSEDYGIVVSKKNPNLAKAVDQALEALKKNGTYDKIYNQWFGKGMEKR
jgi:polar amino acid transport system substrate-binding protein